MPAASNSGLQWQILDGLASQAVSRPVWSSWAIPGFSDVVIHGAEDGKSFRVWHGGKTVSVSHRQLARYLRKRGVHGDVRLLSCHAGVGRLAQDLANKLGVKVRACSRELTIFAGVLAAPADAVWVDFVPGVAKTIAEVEPDAL